MSVLLAMMVMSRYAVVVLISTDRKSKIPALPDPGQASGYILRIYTAVLQDTLPGFARFNLGKSRDVVIVGVTRHAIYMEGKVTCPEIHAACAGHAVRDGFILQGHLSFQVVRHIVQYAAVHEIDNTAGCATAEQQCRGTAKYLNLLGQYRLRGNRVIRADNSGIHGAESVFQHQHAAAAQSADDGTAHTRSVITGRNPQFIGNRFTDVANTAGFQFLFGQNLYGPDYMSIDLG